MENEQIIEMVKTLNIESEGATEIAREVIKFMYIDLMVNSLTLIIVFGALGIGSLYFIRAMAKSMK